MTIKCFITEINDKNNMEIMKESIQVRAEEEMDLALNILLSLIKKLIIQIVKGKNTISSQIRMLIKVKKVIKIKR